MQKRYKTYNEFLVEKKSIEESRFTDWSLKMFKKGTDFAKSVWVSTKRESTETKRALGILRKMIKGEEISNKEKIFLKAQSKDIIRILPLIAIQGIPAPVPITPFLIALGKKYGFSVLPNSHSTITIDDLDKEKLDRL